MQQEELIIDQDGNIEYLEGHCSIEFDGTKTTKRASHVEPFSPVLRTVFNFIRRWLPFLYNWTRTWKCWWRVRMVDYKYTVGPFSSRDSAIEHEIWWLKENRL